MSDPRYTDPLNDPRWSSARDPAARQPLEEDSDRATTWTWIVGIVGVNCRHHADICQQQAEIALKLAV
jgi:hypothetical protein